jgi:hypothetical protein
MTAKAKFECPKCENRVSFTRKKLESGACKCGYVLTSDQRNEVESALLKLEGKKMIHKLEA